MYWTYKIKAAARQRVLMRLIQVFDQQLVLLRRCLLVEHEGAFEVVITVDVEEKIAKRIHAKLYKQYEIDMVEMVEGESGLLHYFGTP